ncbi:unnamed protein product [Paramecium sonneborni]|uniref:Uncharacterized protein n=1 Tax=Paramecium sonneborni TaxID=65129 RepID=A0A8S1LSQ0_9CILI|nr:unnamed protein product [Paramecium sonneborni]
MKHLLKGSIYGQFGEKDEMKVFFKFLMMLRDKQKQQNRMEKGM